jgi:hypothetical protein
MTDPKPCNTSAIVGKTGKSALYITFAIVATVAASSLLSFTCGKAVTNESNITSTFLLIKSGTASAVLRRWLQ